MREGQHGNIDSSLGARIGKYHAAQGLVLVANHCTTFFMSSYKDDIRLHKTSSHPLFGP